MFNANKLKWLLRDFSCQAFPCRFGYWNDVTNIQQMPECRRFAAEPKRRRIAAVQRLFHNHKEPEIQIPVDITGCINAGIEQL